MEKWLPMPDFEQHYEISDHGRVRRTKPYNTTQVGRLRKQRLSNKGYPLVMVSKDCKYCTINVHRIVARAFIGEPKHKKLQVNHKDGDKTNNHVSNLEWVTCSQNQLHYLQTKRKHL